ncbi:MAG: ABC transporter permease [Eubacteriales bacterium]
MKKSSILGWKDVFTFTLKQTIKKKPFIITCIVLLLFAILSMPIIHIITSSATEGENDLTLSPIKKVYVNNETTFQTLDFSEIITDDSLSHFTFENIEEDYDIVANRIEEEENEAIILTISDIDNVYSFDFVKSSKGPITNNDMHLLADVISQEFEAFRVKSLNITEEQISTINAEVSTKVSLVDVNGDPIIKENTSITFNEYWIIYGILFIILLVNIFASTQIASSIVTEKSTRVVEYLLISVRPLALMIGKILATLTAVLIQIVSMIIILFISNKITTTFLSSNEESVITQFIPKDIFQNFNLINILFCLILIAFGMFFYSTLAGLAGATVSKQEELNDGLMLFNITNIVGCYIGLGAANVLMESGINGFVSFSLLFPLSSPFILPGTILVGKASVQLIAAAIALQLVFFIILLLFVARIYEALILHNGNRIKVKELIKLSKTV